MTIQEIKELDDNTAIPEFSATLQFVSVPRGKVQQCKLKDQTGDIQLILISRPPISVDMQGKLVKVQGALASLDTYTGTPVQQVKLLPRGKLIFDPRGSVRAEAPASEPQINGHYPIKLHPGHHAPTSNSSGQRAGMCVKEAHALILAQYKQGVHSAEFFGTPEFANLLHFYCGVFYRESERLEKGEIAPSAKDRAELVAEDKVIQAAEELFTGVQE